MVLPLMHDGLVGQREAFATHMTSMMSLEHRTRWIVGIPRLTAEITQNIFVLDIRFIGTYSKHARLLARTVRGLSENDPRTLRSVEPVDLLVMAQGISLANKCQILFGLAVFALLGAALSVPWNRTGAIVSASQLEVSRQLADTWFENGFSIGRSEGSSIPMRVIRVDEVLFGSGDEDTAISGTLTATDADGLADGTFQVVVANILAGPLVELAPLLAQRTRPGGRVALSGLLVEQADAVMLSGETAAGKYPVECVKVLDRVARRIAQSGGAGYAAEAILEKQRQKTIRAAVSLANSLENARLAVFTREGDMADSTSHLRPDRAPIFAFSPREETVRHLTLNWNTHALRLDFHTDAEETFAAAEEELIKRGLVASGDKIIALRELIEGQERFESIQIRTVP